MNNFTFTICGAKKLKPETVEAIGQMVKAAFEHFKQIECPKKKRKVAIERGQNESVFIGNGYFGEAIFFVTFPKLKAYEDKLQKLCCTFELSKKSL